MTAAAERGRPAAPSGSPVALRRPRLEERLDELFGRRLALVVAGAGFGKSTLLAAWTDELESAWYTVTGRDRALASFAAGVGDAVAPLVGAPLPDEFLGGISSGGEESLRAETLAGALADALGRSVAHDVVLVLDDAHELVGADASLRFLEALARQVPATVHVLVASRADLELRVERLRGQGQLLELASEELAFNLDEIEVLAQGSLADAPGVTVAIHAATDGWPAAVRLALEALRRVPQDGRDAVLARLRRPGSPLFSYLAGEVFEREPVDVRTLIRTVAPLERFTPALCEAIGVAGAERTLEGLVRRGLFVHSQNEWLSLHALVRDFALAVRPLAPREQRMVHERAGAWLESNGYAADALRAYAGAMDPAAIARVLLVHGRDLIASGDADAVVQFGSSLAPAERSREIDELLADAFLARRDFSRAVELLDRWLADAECVEPSTAWRAIASYNRQGDLRAALDILARVRPLRHDGADEALLLGWGATVRIRAGERDDGRELARRAVEVARRCGDDRALAAAHNAAVAVAQSGDRSADVEEHLRVALAAAERARETFQIIRTRTNRSVVLLERGQYRAALDDLDAAIALGDATGAEVAHSLQNRGRLHSRRGALDAALSDYGVALDVLRETGGYESYVWRGLGEVYRERGDLALARTAAERSVEAAERARDVAGLEAALPVLATLLVDDEPDEASRLVQRAVDYRWLDEARAVTASGWIALARGLPTAAIPERALRLAHERGDPYTLAEALELTVFAAAEPASERARLEDALAIWREIGNPVRIAIAELALARLTAGVEARAAAERAERRLRSLGVRVSPAGPAGLLRMVARPSPAALAIETLGGFRVLRAGMPVATSEWSSRKARDLLKILVARRGRATPRELLMEALWPCDDASRLGNRLSVALSTLRSVLDPDKRFDSDHFVRGDAGSVALDLGTTLVDVEVFLHEAERGLSRRSEGRGDEAAESLEQAESAYAGDFLEEDLYEEWATPLREQARAAYVAVAHALAEDRAAYDDDASARYLLRVLARDPYDERAHLALTATMERLGRRGEARRAYRAYVGRMEQIGITPAAFPASQARV